MTRNAYPGYFRYLALALYVTFLVIPGILGILYSFTDWNSFSSEVNFVGFQNFAKIFSPQNNFIGFLGNTIFFTFFTNLLKTLIGFGLALLLTEGVGRLAHVHRAIIYLPVVLPMLVVGLVFKSILNPQTGVLNESLRSVGLGVLAQRWLTDTHIAMWSIVGVDTWKGMGYVMVVLIAGLQVIPKEYYEAAQIDGASYWQRVWRITVPLLMPALTVVTVLNIIYGLKVFDIVYVLTNGGPGYATDVVYTAVFQQFGQGSYGVATALSSVLFVIITVIGLFVVRLMTREENQL